MFYFSVGGTKNKLKGEKDIFSSRLNDKHRIRKRALFVLLFFIGIDNSALKARSRNAREG